MKILLKRQKPNSVLSHPYLIHVRFITTHRALFVCGLSPDLATSLLLSSCEKRFVQWFALSDELTADVTPHLKATAHHVTRVPHRARLWCYCVYLSNYRLT